MNVLDAFNAMIARWTSKLPQWLNVLLVFWLFFSAAVYFGFIGLPEIGWWSLLVMAPMALFVLAVMLQMFALVVGWLVAPFRWLLKKWKSAPHG